MKHESPLAATARYRAPRLRLPHDRAVFTADSHMAPKLHHIGPRGFASAADYEARIRAGLAAAVGPEDTLIHLGDLSWNAGRQDHVLELPGSQKILVAGNHDRGQILTSPGWSLVADYLELVVEMPDGSDRLVILSHYPMASWRAARHSIHLHGHTHGLLPALATERGGRADVGVHVWDWRPVRLAAVIDRIDAVRAASGPLVAGKDY